MIMFLLTDIFVSIGVRFLAGAGFLFTLQYALWLLDTHSLP
jgi:hypothetical protein